MKVAFFPGCMVDMLYPEVGIAAVNVLEKLGCEVELPDDQVCCGQPFSNPHFFADDAEYSKKIADLAPRIYEFTQFIVDVLGVTNVGAHLDGTVTYHKSCHLTRMLGVEEQPLTLLKNVEGLSYIEMPEADRCCGFGGTFSVKEPEVSGHMVQEKVAFALATGADYLCGADQACLMNIKGALDRLIEQGVVSSNMKVMHIAQILDSRLEA